MVRILVVSMHDKKHNGGYHPVLAARIVCYRHVGPQSHSRLVLPIDLAFRCSEILLLLVFSIRRASSVELLSNLVHYPEPNTALLTIVTLESCSHYTILRTANHNPWLQPHTRLLVPMALPYRMVNHVCPLPVFNLCSPQSDSLPSDLFR